MRWLQALLDRLKPRHAEIVRLRLQGRSFAEIGRAVDVSEANARQQYARVVTALRQQHDRPAP